jgi:hypothetical protein
MTREALGLRISRCHKENVLYFPGPRIGKCHKENVPYFNGGFGGAQIVENRTAMGPRTSECHKENVPYFNKDLERP